jgi:hypothetical protein
VSALSDASCVWIISAVECGRRDDAARSDGKRIAGQRHLSSDRARSTFVQGSGSDLGATSENWARRYTRLGHRFYLKMSPNCAVDPPGSGGADCGLCWTVRGRAPLVYSEQRAFIRPVVASSNHLPVPSALNGRPLFGLYGTPN